MIHWDIRNWGRLFAELLLMAIGWIFIVHTDFAGLTLHRKCSKCGKRFLGAWRFDRNYDACPDCGYNLTHNVTGRCSECGWKLTRRYRAHRKKVDRKP